MIGQELLQNVQPGFQGMVPSEDPNPNQGPDPFLTKQLGPPPAFNAVAKAVDRRETMAEIEKAVGQLTQQALAEGTVLTRPQALAKVKAIWAQRAPASPSSTSPPRQPTTTSNQLLSAQEKQASPKRTASPSKTTMSEDTTPQPLTPAPDSLSPAEVQQILDDHMREGGKKHQEMVAQAFYAPDGPPTVADIQRAVGEGNPLIFSPDAPPPLDDPAWNQMKPIPDGHGDGEWRIMPGQEPTKPASDTEGSRAIERGTRTIEPVADETDDVFGKMIETIPGRKTEAQEVDGYTVKHVYDGSQTYIEPDDIFDSMAQPLSNLEDEFKDDVLKSLHPSTGPLLKHLPRRNCFQFFRQSISLVGLPSWSRWLPGYRVAVEKAYQELASDSFEVDQVVRRLQAFSVQYGKTRLLRMVATILGMQAWMNVEVLDGSAD